MLRRLLKSPRLHLSKPGPVHNHRPTVYTPCHPIRRRYLQLLAANATINLHPKMIRIATTMIVMTAIIGMKANQKMPAFTPSLHHVPAVSQCPQVLAASGPTIPTTPSIAIAEIINQIETESIQGADAQLSASDERNADIAISLPSLKLTLSAIQVTVPAKSMVLMETTEAHCPTMWRLLGLAASLLVTIHVAVLGATTPEALARLLIFAARPL
mmetsp:Transcript_17394/g.48203  ORF Transcript_17394/g.48203 Transcript_17394/m.48203 type:complete len:214 (+) Transcript_17394:96-737(+)